MKLRGCGFSTMIAGLWVKLVATMGRDELAGFGARTFTQ